MALAFDHLAVAGATLAEAVAHVEATLGVSLGPGGEHVQMGTHNRLLSLGPEVYLEAIAINPDAPPPGRPRWFALDAFSGPARVTNWIVRVDDLAAALYAAPEGMGVPMALARGDYRWQMAVPDDGCLPFGGAAPAMIEWEGTAHPATALTDVGCRLVRFEVAHPQAAELLDAFPALAGMPDVTIVPGPALVMAAVIDTPNGRRVLR